jgi:hypothetical protein
MEMSQPRVNFGGSDLAPAEKSLHATVDLRIWQEQEVLHDPGSFHFLEFCP